MSGNAVDPQIFMHVVKPLLCRGDADTLARAVSDRWDASELCGLLFHDDVDVRRVTAITLGFVGDTTHQGCLAKALHDRDEQVNRMAEHGLWSIWFRGGSDDAMPLFQQGVQHLEDEEYVQAVPLLRQTTEADPGFAEAYNQLAIAHYFQGNWTLAIDWCEKTIDRVPIHFGAIAGMGHAYAQMSRFAAALRCYQQALRVNPRMPAIRGAVKRLEAASIDRGDNGDLPAFDRPLM